MRSSDALGTLPVKHVLLSMFVLVFSVYVYALFLPSGTYLSYEKDCEVSTQFLPYQYYSTEGTLEIPFNYYTIWVRHIGTQSPPHRYILYTYAVGFGLILCLWAVLATYLPRFWYVLAQGALACCLYGSNLQHLQLFGRVDNYFYLIFFPLFVISYYINRHQRPLSFPLRTLIFVGLFTLLALVIEGYSTTQYPFLVFVYQSYYLQLCIGILMCLIVGHQLAYLILRVCSSAGFGNSLGQFVLIGVLYTSYLILFYLSNIGYANWGMVYVDEFTLLAGSMCVGFIGIKGWAHHYTHIVPQSLIQINYLVMAVATCLLVLMLRVHGNDPALEVLEDAVLFGHLGFGVGFFVYVLSKYRHALSRNIEVWKVVYARPGDNDFLSVRIAGLLIGFICYALSDGAMYNHAISGSYLQQATLAHIDQIDPLRDRYLKMAALFGYQGHSANYSLGKYATERNELHRAVTYYRSAAAKHPTPHAFVNLSHVLYRLELFESSKKTLQKGLQHFPSNKFLANNLGLHYLVQEKWDSAIYFLKQAEDLGYSNLLLAQSIDHLPPSSLSVVDQTNMWAYSVKHSGDSVGRLDTLSQSPYTLNYVHNYLLLLLQRDPERLLKEVQYLRVRYPDPLLVHDMSRLEAFANYACGRTASAFRILKRLIYRYPRYQGFYYYVLGTWSLLEGAHTEAQTFFTTSYQLGYQSSKPLSVQLFARLTSSDLKKKQAEQIFDTLAQENLSTRSDSILESVEMNTYAQVWKTLPSHLRESMRVLVGRYLLEKKRYREVETWLKDYSFLDTLWRKRAQLLRAEAMYASISAESSLREALQSLEERIPHKSYLAVPLDSTQVIQWKQEVEEHVFQVYFTVRNAERLRQTGHELLAYDLLLQAIELHPYSSTLQKAYLWDCVSLGLESYADKALLDIKHIVSPDQWKKIYEEYILLTKQRQEREEAWR